MREPVNLACDALRSGRPLNMGQCTELFDVARDEEEAMAITIAYADFLEQHNSMTPDAAAELARKNINTGLSYMCLDTADAIYRRAFAASPLLVAKEPSE